MDYRLTEDQAALVSALQSILKDYSSLPQSARLAYHYYDPDLQRVLTEGGFLDAAREMGPLEAALVVTEIARIPVSVEAGVSALVAPLLLPEERLEGPLAIVPEQAIGKAQRNLSIAKTVLVDGADAVTILPVDSDLVEPVTTIYAYPFGRFKKMPSLKGRRLDKSAVAILRQWYRVALAAEIAGAAQSAVAFTVDYVKERHVFGRAIGSFQAVQHRLAQCHQIARGIYYMSLKAAWSGEALDADMAVCYAQQNIQKLIFDLHQFNGAMGVTNEHMLHFWTYRLRALQAEAGGATGSALDIADRLWGAA